MSLIFNATSHPVVWQTGNESFSSDLNASFAGTPEPTPQWAFLALTVIPVWMLGGNSLVLLSVLYQRNLRNLSNRVIASLAFTDFLLALVVVPFGIYQLVHGQWVLGFYVCLVWTGSDVILSTASIMHLCAIALYRYHGIAYPLHGRQRSHVAILVVPAWTISVALSIPFVVQAVLDESNVLEETDSHGHLCGIFNQTFAVYSSLVSFFIPLTVMTVADVYSIQILRRRIDFPFQPNASVVGLKYGRRLDVTPGAAAIQLTSNDRTTVSPTSRLMTSRFGSRAAGQKQTTMSLEVPTTEVVPPTSSCSGCDVELTEMAMLNRKGSGDSAAPSSATAAADGSIQRYVYRGRSRSKSMIYIDMLASCGASKVNGRERRAEKTLIWVFAAFVVLWLPFFSTNLIYGVCGERCHIPPALFQVFVWFGYMSSGVNPCIYTLLNRDFRHAFKNLLACRGDRLKSAHLASAVSSFSLPSRSIYSSRTYT